MVRGWHDSCEALHPTMLLLCCVGIQLFCRGSEPSFQPKVDFRCGSWLTGPPFPRGEQTAAALEANLTNLESKLDELLAAFEDIAGDSPAPLANGNRQQEDLDPKHQTDNTADKSN